MPLRYEPQRPGPESRGSSVRPRLRPGLRPAPSEGLCAVRPGGGRPRAAPAAVASRGPSTVCCQAHRTSSTRRLLASLDDTATTRAKGPVPGPRLGARLPGRRGGGALPGVRPAHRAEAAGGSGLAAILQLGNHFAGLLGKPRASVGAVHTGGSLLTAHGEQCHGHRVGEPAADLANQTVYIFTEVNDSPEARPGEAAGTGPLNPSAGAPESQGRGARGGERKVRGASTTPAQAPSPGCRQRPEPWGASPEGGAHSCSPSARTLA